MNPQQILAIISLLLAFGTPQATVDKVQSILNNTVPVVQTTVQPPIVVPDPIFGSISIAPVAPTCPSTPTIGVKPEKGTLNGDTITVASSTSLTYIDVTITDPCVDFHKLNFTMTSSYQSFTKWTNPLEDNTAFGVPGTTPESIEFTASEPDGATVTRTIQIQPQ